MLILGFDTCTETIDVALLEDGRTISSRRESAPRRHLTLLVPYISELMKEKNFQLSDLDLISLTTGPGSFTGIRLGLATARTLSQINDIALASVNTIEALAATCPVDGIVVPSLDARKREIIFSVYEKKKNEFKRLTAFKRVRYPDYFKYLDEMKYDNFTITGSVLKRYSSAIKETVCKNYSTPPEQFWTPCGEAVARIGQEIFEKGKTVRYTELKADYMRKWETTRTKPLIS